MHLQFDSWTDFQEITWERIYTILENSEAFVAVKLLYHWTFLPYAFIKWDKGWASVELKAHPGTGWSLLPCWRDTVFILPNQSQLQEISIICNLVWLHLFFYGECANTSSSFARDGLYLLLTMNNCSVRTVFCAFSQNLRKQGSEHITSTDHCLCQHMDLQLFACQAPQEPEQPSPGMVPLHREPWRRKKNN